MDKKEVREAIQAGEAALDSMEKARRKLGSAKNWGLFDILCGGVLSSFVKHSEIDDASSYLEEAKRNIAIFKRELKDVSLSVDFSIDPDSLLRFVDVFMDNVFVDVMVQSQINDAITGLDQASDRIRTILTKLYSAINEQEK